MESSKTPRAGSSSAGAQEGTPVPGSNDDRVVNLESEIKELSAKLQKMTDIAARAQADLQNAKTRMQNDGQSIRKFAAEVFVLKLLPTIDNFQRAFRHLPEELQSHDWVKGIAAIEQELIRRVSEMGLKKMECLGQQVDTARHEVITIGSGKEGVILDVIEDGYEFHGKTLRPAKVRVGDGTMNAAVHAMP